MLQNLLDLLFPRRSLTGGIGEWITDAERSQLQSHPVIQEKESLQKQGLNYIDRIVSASSYHDCPLLRKAIHTFKYGRIPALHHDLGKMLLSVTQYFKDDNSIVLCPVPLHWSRRFSRGFNQSMLLASIVSEKEGWPIANVIKRVRPTGHQTRRKREERFHAMKNAFSVRKGIRVPDCVLLIDDLATTGATLENCAKALKEAGVKRVEALTVAHG